MVSFNMTDQESRSTITQNAPTPKAALSPKDSRRSQAQESGQGAHEGSFIEEEKEQELSLPAYGQTKDSGSEPLLLNMAKLNMAAVQEKAQND